jgi:hypothetical protein
MRRNAIMASIAKIGSEARPGKSTVRGTATGVRVPIRVRGWAGHVRPTILAELARYCVGIGL